MSKIKFLFGFLAATLLFPDFQANAQSVEKWTIPAGGNSYLIRKQADAGRDRESWQSADDKYLFFFRADRPGTVDLSLNLAVPEGESHIKAQAGKKNFDLKIS